ncbi:sulfite exporter TauE/SafE family protein [Flavobacterium rhizosphaerae]|uniref:Probable membrane transporter protein n=1 Tax=Flavobacterium rhizosphaerae TaxID=3163298 RepID=A0ABW8YW31_9FLAO
MTNVLLILSGFAIGTFGTLIGAGGGFMLVPLLLIFYPELSPEIVTGISIAVVAVNAISGTFAYGKSRRIDYKAGIIFALFTIPGSILGVYTVQFIPQKTFNLIFGLLLILLSAYLFLKRMAQRDDSNNTNLPKHHIQHILTDSKGTIYRYSYNPWVGNIISIVVGFISPLLGIGGGIIHVPAMAHWLKFPVYIATATSHFILAIMATVSVLTHVASGTYSDTETQYMILFLIIGVVPGAQLGAYFSHKVKSQFILRALAACLVIVGIRILLNSF